MSAGKQTSARPINPARGRMLVLIAAVLWSTSGLFAKAPVFDNWDLETRGIVLAFWRATFAAAALLPFVRQPCWTPRLIPAVSIFAVMNVTFLTALSLSEAALAIWLQNTAPVWVFLFGVLLLKERATRRDYLLLLCCVTGIGLIIGFEARGAAGVGVAWGICGGLTYAGVILSLRWLRDIEPMWIIALNHLITAIVLLPFVIAIGQPPTGEQLLYLAGFGVLQMGIPYVLFATGLRSIPGHEASGIALLEPILVPVWVYLAWSSSVSYTPPTTWTIVGALFILTGLLIRYASVPGRRRQAEHT